MEGRHFALVGTLTVLVLLCAGPSTVSGASRFKRQASGGAGVGLGANVNASLGLNLTQALATLINSSSSLPIALQQALGQFLTTGAGATANLTAALQLALNEVSAVQKQVIQDVLNQIQNATAQGSAVLQQVIQQAITDLNSTTQALTNLTQNLITQLISITLQNPASVAAQAAQSLLTLAQNGSLTAPLLTGISSGVLAANATIAQTVQFLQSVAGNFGTVLNAGITANLGVISTALNLGLTVFVQTPIQVITGFMQAFLGFLG